MLLAEVLQHDAQILPDLVANRARDANAVQRGQRLQSRRDIDAVAGDIVAVADDVPEIDANAQMEPLGRVLVGFLREIHPLNGDAASERGGGAGKFRQKPVAGGLDDAPAELGDLGIDHLLAQRLQAREGAQFVALHERAVTRDIG